MSSRLTASALTRCRSRDTIVHVLHQVVGDAVVRVSSVTGVGLAELTNLIAATAVVMPHVNDLVPSAYVALQKDLDVWSGDLVAEDKPPVQSYADVQRHLLASPSGRAAALLSGGIPTALHCITSWCGVVVTSDGVVVLDPHWLADVLACVITVDPVKIAALSPEMRRGVLEHSPSALASVWPTYSTAIR